DVRPLDRFAGIADAPQAAHRAGPRLVAVGTRGDDLVAEQIAERGERDEDVRAVADRGDADALEGTDPVADRQRVGERLAWVLVRGQRVDDRDRGPLGPRLELGMLVGANG